MTRVKDIRTKRTANRQRMEKEAPDLFRGFNRDHLLDFLDEIEAAE